MQTQQFKILRFIDHEGDYVMIDSPLFHTYIEPRDVKLGAWRRKKVYTLGVKIQSGREITWTFATCTEAVAARKKFLDLYLSYINESPIIL